MFSLIGLIFTSRRSAHLEKQKKSKFQLTIIFLYESYAGSLIIQSSATMQKGERDIVLFRSYPDSNRGRQKVLGKFRIWSANLYTIQPDDVRYP